MIYFDRGDWDGKMCGLIAKAAGHQVKGWRYGDPVPTDATMALDLNVDWPNCHVIDHHHDPTLLGACVYVWQHFYPDYNLPVNVLLNGVYDTFKTDHALWTQAVYLQYGLKLLEFQKPDCTIDDVLRLEPMNYAICHDWNMAQLADVAKTYKMTASGIWVMNSPLQDNMVSQFLTGTLMNWHILPNGKVKISGRGKGIKPRLLVLGFEVGGHEDACGGIMNWYDFTQAAPPEFLGISI